MDVWKIPPIPAFQLDKDFLMDEKTLALPGYFADTNHTASPMVRLRVYNLYRQTKPFFWFIRLLRALEHD